MFSNNNTDSGTLFGIIVMATVLLMVVWTALHPKAPYVEPAYQAQHPQCAQGGTIKSYKGVEVCAYN